MEARILQEPRRDTKNLSNSARIHGRVRVPWEFLRLAGPRSPDIPSVDDARVTATTVVVDEDLHAMQMPAGEVNKNVAHQAPGRLDNLRVQPSIDWSRLTFFVETQRPRRI